MVLSGRRGKEGNRDGSLCPMERVKGAAKDVEEEVSFYTLNWPKSFVFNDFDQFLSR